MSFRVKLAAVVAFVLLASAAFAQSDISGVFTEITGKVEIQLAGSAAWKPAKVGLTIAKQTTISTGFKSEAAIKLGSAVVRLKPLTRLLIQSATLAGGKEETTIFLVTGKVSTEVTKTAGVETVFQVTSPTATASVRGTGFEFDGINLRVYHGLVVIQSPTGVQRSVGAGEVSSVTDPATVQVPTFVGDIEGVVLTTSTFDFGFQVLPGDAPYIPPTEGSIVIILE